MGFLTITLQGIEKKNQASIAGMVAQRSQGCPGILAAPDSSIHDSITPSTPPQAGPTSPGDRCSPVDLSLKKALVYSDLNQSAVSYSAIATAKNSN